MLRLRVAVAVGVTGVAAAAAATAIVVTTVVAAIAVTTVVAAVEAVRVWSMVPESVKLGRGSSRLRLPEQV